MRRDAVASVVSLLVFTALLGVAYPLATTAVAGIAWPNKAGGSRIEAAGRTVGSRVIGQDFAGPRRRAAGRRYFQSRPSADAYNPAATSFNNLGPNSRKLAGQFRANVRTYLARERLGTPGLRASAIPADAVQTSASGVDPHISQANARIQARRVAKVRGIALARVLALVARNTDGRGLGILGEPGVNVLTLNLALDREAR